MKKKGISLIVLIITIVIVLVLATVIIVSLSGENGIIKAAKKALKSHNESVYNEWSSIEQAYQNERTNITSMYSWNLTRAMKDMHYDLVNVLKVLNINSLYQDMKDVDLKTNTEVQEFIKYVKDRNIDVYYLTGRPEWALDTNAVEIKKEIDKVYEYNISVSREYQLKGIVLDVEFYRNDSYDLDQAAAFDTYYEVIKLAYEYAKSKNIRVAVCIPWWLDNKFGDAALEKIMKDCADNFEVMNYTKANSVKNIQKEVEFAQKYNKQVTSIAELQEPVDHDLTDDLTFYNDGIDACIESLQNIKNSYNYPRLGTAYHYYVPAKELIGRVIYMYELYPYYHGRSTELKNVVLTYNGNKVLGQPYFIKSSNEYVQHFYGLRYDTDYQIEVVDHVYGGTKTINIPIAEANHIKYGTLTLSKLKVYNYELYFYDETDTPLEIKSGYLQCGDLKIPGKPMYIESSKEYVMQFENVAYDREYTLVIEDPGYVATKKVLKPSTEIKDWFYSSVTVRKK